MLDAHDLIADELFKHHSLGALDYLIAHGRELEFIFKEKDFFISKHHSPKYVTLSGENKEQDLILWMNYLKRQYY